MVNVSVVLRESSSGKNLKENWIQNNICTIASIIISVASTWLNGNIHVYEKEYMNNWAENIIVWFRLLCINRATLIVSNDFDFWKSKITLSGLLCCFFFSLTGFARIKQVYNIYWNLDWSSNFATSSRFYSM